MRMVGIPLPLLTCLADISTALTHLAGKEPMLTRSKIMNYRHLVGKYARRLQNVLVSGISLEHAHYATGWLIVLFKGVLTFR